MSLGIGLNNGGYDQGLLEMWSSAVSLQLRARQTCHRKPVDRRKHVGYVLGLSQVDMVKDLRPASLFMLQTLPHNSSSGSSTKVRHCIQSGGIPAPGKGGNQTSNHSLMWEEHGLGATSLGPYTKCYSLSFRATLHPHLMSFKGRQDLYQQ